MNSPSPLQRTLERVVSAQARYDALGLGAGYAVESAELIWQTYHSTALEGSTLTLGETEVLLRDGTPPASRSLADAIMVADHGEAAQWWFEQVVPSATPVTPALLRELNGRLQRRSGKIIDVANGRTDTSTGQYRNASVVMAGGEAYPDYPKVPARVEQICAQISSELFGPVDPLRRLLLAYSAHFDLVDIHPWFDGNKRTARLLQHLIERRSGIVLGVVPVESKAAYIDALRTQRRDGGTAFIELLATLHAQRIEGLLDQHARRDSPRGPSLSQLLAMFKVGV